MKKQRPIFTLIGVFFIISILFFAPSLIPIYAIDEGILAGIGVGIVASIVFSVIAAVIVNAIDDKEPKYYAHPEFGFAALKNKATHNTNLLEDSDFGLDASVNNSIYGQKRIAADIQDSDFGLNAKTNDPIYGLKRIAADIQHEDWGLETIDDEIEVIDARIDKQVTKQRVDVSVIKSSTNYYVLTAESGIPVDVEFVKISLIKRSEEVLLKPNQYTITPMTLEGVYVLDLDINPKFSGLFIQVKHHETPIIHEDLGVNIPAHHFGDILVETSVEKSTVQ